MQQRVKGLFEDDGAPAEHETEYKKKKGRRKMREKWELHLSMGHLTNS